MPRAASTSTVPAMSAFTTTPSSCAAARTWTRCRRSCDELGATIVDPAGEYYDDYYAVFFLDPDGLKLEGMKYGERHAHEARRKRVTQ